jgi:glycosyltransferase involved in cell wall biosynthesis
VAGSVTGSGWRIAHQGVPICHASAQVRDIVVVGGVRWDAGVNQPSTQMVRELSRTHRVLYLYNEQQGSALRNFISPIGAGARTSAFRHVVGTMTADQHDSRLWLAPLRGIPALTPLSYPEPLRQVNGLRLARFLRSAIHSLHFEAPILWFYWWFYPEMVSRIPHRLSVYDCIDDHGDYPSEPSGLGVGKSNTKHEKRLLRSVDVTFAVSPHLAAIKGGLTRRCFYAPQGIDLDVVEHAKQQAAPADLSGIPRPIIGYAGGISHRLDWQLLYELAATRHDWSFVLVGGSRPKGQQPVPNVRFLSPRPYPEMLRAICEFDVAVVPFVDRPHTRGNFPLKLLDYLSLNKPIVATPLPSVIELQREMAGMVSVATGPDEWTAQIERALGSRGGATEHVSARIRERYSSSARAESMMSKVEDLAS